MFIRFIVFCIINLFDHNLTCSLLWTDVLDKTYLLSKINIHIDGHRLTVNLDRNNKEEVQGWRMFWRNCGTVRVQHNTSNNHGKDSGSCDAFSIRDGDTEVIPGGSEVGYILV